jgi:hypothetical protein
MGRLFRISAIALLGCCLLGCASFKDHMKGLLGISTREVDAGRKTALTKTVDYDYATTYKMTLNVLNEIGSYVYAGNIGKHMVAIYRSQTDTTPVGIYFKAMSSATTQIEISSPSTFTKNEVAGKIFSAFEEKTKGDVPQGATPSQPK